MDTAVRQAVALQRDLAIEEEAKAQAEIKREGCKVLELDAAGHAAFVAAVRPLRAEVHRLYAPELLSLLP